jgi:diguanylate cyclase (GGDEF)-like protein
VTAPAGWVPRKIGELGVPVTPMPAHTPIDEVRALLEANTMIPGVVVDEGGRRRVLGRPLVFRGAAAGDLSTIGQIASVGATLEMPGGTDIDLAAEATLARPAAEREEPVLITWADGRVGVAGAVDVLAAMAGRFTKSSRADPLTGLPNRAQAQAEAQRRLEAGELIAVLHLGLDRFQDANDVLGHHGADTLLRLVAVALRDACGPVSTAARLDGDQFVVLVSGLPPGMGPVSAARRLVGELRGPHQVDGLPISVEMSVGVSVPGPGQRDAALLMRRAAGAMRRAKHERTGVVEWTTGLDTDQRVDLRQLTELRAGLRAGHLRLHYQPLHDANSRRRRGVEALVRWQHPQRGLLPPGVFLPDAERSDVILELTDWVLAEAMHQAAVWHRAGHDVPVSINLPAAYLAQDRAVPTIMALVRMERLPPALLTMEITETAVLTQPDRVAAQLAELRATGIRVAIDDFGTGYTSLGLLPRLPIDELKIDQSFVLRMHESPAHATIIDSVIAIARSLGLIVVAEGVEDEVTAAGLAAAGVDLLQGYHLNRPAPPQALAL